MQYSARLCCKSLPFKRWLCPKTHFRATLDGNSGTEPRAVASGISRLLCFKTWIYAAPSRTRRTSGCVFIPLASTTPRGLPAWGPRSARGSVTSGHLSFPDFLGKAGRDFSTFQPIHELSHASDKSHSDWPLVCGGVFSGVWLVRPPRFATAVANSGPVMGFAKCIW